MVSGPAIVPAGNKAVVSALTKMRSNHSVLLRAHLQNGCSEKGRGSGEYEGCAFEMRYTIGWNEGYLETGEYDGYPIHDVIAVLSQYPLAKIGHDQFGLRPGQLQSGYGEEYQIDWEDDEPEDAPDGFTLHGQMDIDDCEYEWGAAASLEIEVSEIGASLTIDH